jgi:hypothetical protein
LWVGTQITFVAPNSPTPTGPLVSDGVVWITDALGTSDPVQQTGVFTPSASVSTQGDAAGIEFQQGITISSQGIALAEGIALGEGIALSEGIALGEAIALAEGVALAEAIALAEGTVLAQYGPMPGE